MLPVGTLEQRFHGPSWSAATSIGVSSTAAERRCLLVVFVETCPYLDIRFQRGDSHDRESSTLLVLITGLPASGKSTLARRLAPKIPPIRLDKDQWTIQLGHDPWDDDFRPLIEAQLWILTQALARSRSERDFGVGPLGQSQNGMRNDLQRGLWVLGSSCITSMHPGGTDRACSATKRVWRMERCTDEADSL